MTPAILIAAMHETSSTHASCVFAQNPFAPEDFPQNVIFFDGQVARWQLEIRPDQLVEHVQVQPDRLRICGECAPGRPAVVAAARLKARDVVKRQVG